MAYFCPGFFSVGGNNNGTDTSPLVEHWNGKRWAIAPGTESTGGGSWLDNVHAVPNGDLWAIGESYQPYRPFIQHWNGHLWSEVPTPFIGDNNLLTAVAGTSNHNAWAVGGEPSARADESIPIEHWNGTVWKLVAGPAPNP